MAALLFGWRPYEFWEATPAELAVILAEMTPGRGDGPPCGDELARLMEMFPDG
ncbi:MAG TPA: phage tail assembly chaperone [Rhizorhapis sp.]